MKIAILTISAFVLALPLAAAPKTDYEKMAQAKPEEVGAAPLGTKWHAVNAELVATETSDKALEVWLSSSEKCQELLLKVKTGYQTKPIDAIVIAAVTQYVMTPNKAAKRGFWVKSIISELKKTNDAMIAHFYLDQLRWCGEKEQIPEIKAAVSQIKNKELQKFVEQLFRELNRNCPGL